MGETVFTAREFLRQLMTGAASLEDDDWAEPTERGTSRHFRYLQLTALASAFQFESLGEVWSGAFLERLDPTVYRALAERLIERGGSDRTKPARASGPLLRSAFSSLLRYRRNAERVLKHHDGLLECSIDLLLGPVAMIEEANRSFTTTLDEVEATLADFLDPVGRSFTKRELVENFGYPDVEVRHLELEEMWGIDEG